MTSNNKSIVVAITGASGPVLGIRLIEELLLSGEKVIAIVSEAAWSIIRYEMSIKDEAFSSLIDLVLKRGIVKNIANLNILNNKDFFSGIASGSTCFEAIIVIPCSMKTLSAISHGYADSLIVRAFDVALKERRRSIIVPRETPLNLIHIENLYRVAKAGAEILLPVPGFYTFPKSVDDIIDFIVGKVLNLLGIKHSLFKSWEDILKNDR